MRSLWLVTVAALMCCVGWSGAYGAAPSTKPVSRLSPDDARAAFELEPGLAVQLVAAEPLVMSPCAVAWDEYGRMYVAENRGYPLGGPNGKPVGVIALLEDTDGDGLPDKRCDFATGLSFPNGVLPWRGGLIVTDSPDVLYYKDADGDGRAEIREVLLTGFATDKSTQLRVNAPTLGPDGWVYLAGGLSAGKIYSPKNPSQKLNIGRTDLKFRPDTGEMEPVEGKGQYGLTFDDAGHRFVCNNRVQVQHAPLPARYLARNPKVISPGILNNCPDRVRNLMLGLPNDAGAKVFPISSNVTTADSHAGTYSAACAVHIERGDALPAEYIGKVWSCDPTANLVRYDELEPDGGSFHAKRVRDNVEAMRSRDDWCRPVFLADGPDGALYVCDMYRKTIEHPEYLPEEVRKHTDFESGKNMGRIWRIARKDLTPQALAIHRGHNLKSVSASDSSELVSALRSSNGWVRDTVMRVLTERGAASVATQLEALASATDAPPASTVCALNLLSNAGKLSDSVLAVAMKHSDAIVRETAVRLSESRLSASPALAGQVLALTSDPQVHVRYAAVLAAGEIRSNESRDHAIDALANPALAGDANDKWFRAAICTSLPAGEDLKFLEKLANSGDKASDDGVLALIQELAGLLAADLKPDQAKSAFDSLFAAVAPRSFPVRAAALAGFVDRGGTPAADALHEEVKTHPDSRLTLTIVEAGNIAVDASAAVNRRIGAAELLALAGDAKSQEVLLSLVVPEQPVDLAIAAISGLVRDARDTSGASRLLDAKRWARYSPALRTTVLTLLSGNPKFAGPMLDAIESGALPAAALSEPQRALLKKVEDPALAARAEKLLTSSTPEDRKKAYEDAKSALQLTGVASNGKAVFVKTCSTCHRLDREGYAVGPDLYGIRNQPKESILLHIVIPEQEVQPNFAAYDCLTTDGRAITGIMTADTPESVTLRQSLGIEETIPRKKIKRISASKFSLMPPGLEQSMTKQELADLLAYLRGE